MNKLAQWVWILLICILCGGPAIFIAMGAFLVVMTVYNIILHIKAKRTSRKGTKDGSATQ